jgi:hypothetical protein
MHVCIGKMLNLTTLSPYSFQVFVSTVWTKEKVKAEAAKVNSPEEEESNQTKQPIVAPGHCKSVKSGGAY